jgi:hypothetical protein
MISKQDLNSRRMLHAVSENRQILHDGHQGISNSMMSVPSLLNPGSFEVLKLIIPH